MSAAFCDDAVDSSIPKIIDDLMLAFGKKINLCLDSILK
jgi:hypothetical protein